MGSPGGKPFVLFCAGEDSGDILGEALVQVTSDPLCGRVRGPEVRKLVLEILQLAHKMVIVEITHCRSVVNIVPPAVLPEGIAQFEDSCLCLLPVHPR